MTTRANASAAAAQPRGMRRPLPGLGALLLRVALIIVLVLYGDQQWRSVFGGSDLPVSPPPPTPIVTRPAPTAGLPTLPNPAALLPTPAAAEAWFMQQLSTPAAVTVVRQLAMLGGGWLTLELLLILGTAVVQRRVLPGVPRTFLRIQAVRPTVTTPARGTRAGLDDLYRALGAIIPPPGLAALIGCAPWVTLTLWGAADTPTTLGLMVADMQPERRARTVAQLITLIEGQLPGAQVTVIGDPLDTSNATTTVIERQTLRLALASHYPLRAADDVGASALLGPLLAATQPPTGVWTEVQIMVQPDPVVALHRGWRGRGMALLLRLMARDDYALTPDAKAVEAKLHATPFRAQIHVLVSGAAAHEVASVRTQIVRTFSQYHTRIGHAKQELVPGTLTSHASYASARAPAWIPPPLIVLAPLVRGVPVLSSIELAGMWHLPDPALGDLIGWLPCRVLAPPPAAFVDDDRDRLVLGMAAHSVGGALAPIGVPLRDARQGLACSAPPGVGKSRLLANLCGQLASVGYVLLDGKGDDSGNLVETVRQRIARDDEARTVIVDVLDTEWPVGLNLLAEIDVTNALSIDQALGQIESVFSRLDPDTWGRAPRMKKYLRKATLLVASAETHPTLAHVKQALLDPTYRARLLPHCDNVEVRSFWEVEFPTAGETQLASLDALGSRFDMLLDSPLTRMLFTAAKPTFSFARAIEERQIVLIPLPHRSLGGLAGPVGMLLFQLMIRAAFARPGSDLSRREYGLVCDEFQVLVERSDAQDVRDALTQVRAFGVVTILAHQLLAQLGDLKEFVLTAVANRVVMQTQEPDAGVYARHYAASGVSASDISNQPALAHQYVTLLSRGQRTGLCSMQPLSWPAVVDVPCESVTSFVNWQRVVPAAAPDDDAALDRLLLELAYAPPRAQLETIAARLAQLSAAEWELLTTRWTQIANAQVAFLTAHPGAIPDRLERQRARSRLLIARPRMLALAEYHRIRAVVRTPPTRSAGSGGGATTKQNGDPQGEALETTPDSPYADEGNA